MAGAIAHREHRPASFYWLALVFGLFVLFLYGPVITIFILSFQGPEGGLTFPMRGVSLHWFSALRDGVGDIDIWAAFARSVKLALAVTVLTVLFSLSAGLAFRRRFAAIARCSMFPWRALSCRRSSFRSALASPFACSIR
ncbi:binding-protein-dependent transport systems inner membrane component [Caballeronia temeraria]|uniref:Binding-protein-dependent transport systems inner membrane component n=1 Tax=Caballeronia temeraria TaxID=1777137 RepID=A0A158DPY4_9BURK|nr:binding-protein-dependent transport systems inner membrane component [Caballeronia temeraria]